MGAVLAARASPLRVYAGPASGEALEVFWRSAATWATPLGRAAYDAAAVPDAMLAALVVIAVLVATCLILTEGCVMSDWGVMARPRRTDRTEAEERSLCRARLVEKSPGELP